MQALNAGDQGVEDLEEEEDDEAQEFFSKKRADYPFQSKTKSDNKPAEGNSDGVEERKLDPSEALTKQASAAEFIENLSDGDSDSHDVAAGEQEGADENADVTEREIWRKLDQNKYQSRYTNFNEEENESRMEQLRRSSEYFGRKSITSKMMMRRSTTYVPGLGGVNDSLA